MRKTLALFIALSLLITFSFPQTGYSEAVRPEQVPAASAGVIPAEEAEEADDDALALPGYDDPDFSALAANKLYLDVSELLYDAGYEDAVVRVDVAYRSQEYLEELAYNSQENVYFGYRLSDLNEAFKGTRYVFACDAQGVTVKAFEAYDDAYDQILRNVAIGTGIIVVCVTITLATGGFAAPAAATAVSAINIIFRSAASSAAISALAGGGIAALIQANAVAIQTGDWDAAVKAAALAGSERYMWGAVIGAGTGMISGAVQYCKALKALKALPKTPIERLMEMTPAEGKNGHWVKGERGNGEFVNDAPAVKRLLAEKGLKSIAYRNGVPDFSPLAEAKVEITGKYLDALINPNSAQVRYAMQREAKEILAARRGVSVADIREWMSRNNIAIHEDINMTTLSFVPRLINSSFPHFGGVSEYVTRLALSSI